MGQNLHVAIVQLHSESCVWEVFKDYAFNLDSLFLVLLRLIRWSFSRHESPLYLPLAVATLMSQGTESGNEWG